MTLIARGYLYQTPDARPILRLKSAAKAILKGEKQLFYRQDLIAHRTVTDPGSHYKSPFYEPLKELRLSLARERDIPAYAIFTDATLREISEKRPKTPGEFLNIRGIGMKKLDQYGSLFIEKIKELEAGESSAS